MMNKLYGLIYLFDWIRIKLKFGRKVRTDGVDRIKIGTQISIHNDGIIRLGYSVRTSENSKISCDGGELSIGNNTGFNRNTIISCHSKITIGNNCLFAPNLCIYDHDHKFDYNGLREGYSVGEISIGNRCWIGANVTILKNTRIGDGCIIGAGCVIKGDIPAHSIVKGNREIRIEPIKVETD